MKKIVAVLIAVALMVLGFVVVSTQVASADRPMVDVCVPQDAWTEEIDHPEETEDILHEAVTHTEWKYVKHTHTKTKNLRGQWSEYGPWTVWGDGNVDVTWSSENVEGLGSPQFHGQGTDRKVEWYREWQLRNTGVTREIVDKEAWVETVVTQEAWTEIIEHEAVECIDTTPDITIEIEDDGPPVGIEVGVTSSTSVKCLGGALVTTTTDENGNSDVSIVSGHKKCPQVTPNGGALVEEGM